jgi:uncharacterized membrane protein YgcG
MKGKRPDADALKAWADSLDPAQCPALLTELEKMDGGQPRDAMITAMIASWAARDPNGYLKDYSKVADPRARETGVDGALKSLAATDPKAALAFMTDSTDALSNQLMARRYRSTLQGYAEDDPAGALSFVQGLDTNNPLNAQVQRQGLQAVADAMANNGNFTDALKMFSSLPPAEATTANARLMNQWAQLAPTDAAQYVASISDPAQQSTAATQLARTWARDDPQAAAAWAVQLAATNAATTGQPDNGVALASTMRTWAREDLNASAAFLNTLTPSPTTDPAVVAFATQARTTDPASAMTWSAQITDPTLRERTQGSVAVQMLASGDMTDLNAAIANNTVTADQAAWLATLPTDNPQALNRMARRLGNNFATNPNRPAPWAPVDPNAPAAAPGAGRGGAGAGAAGGGGGRGGVGGGFGGRGGGGG